MAGRIENDKYDDEKEDEDDEDQYFHDHRATTIEFTTGHIDRIDMGSGTYWYWHPEQTAQFIIQKDTKSYMPSIDDLDLLELTTKGPPTKNGQEKNEHKLLSV